MKFGNSTSATVQLVSYDVTTNEASNIINEVISIGDCKTTNKRRSMQALALKKVDAGIIKLVAEARWMNDDDDDDYSVAGKSDFNGIKGYSLRVQGTDAEVTLNIPTKKRSSKETMVYRFGYMVVGSTGAFEYTGDTYEKGFASEVAMKTHIRNTQEYKHMEKESWKTFPVLNFEYKNDGNRIFTAKLIETKKEVGEESTE